MKRKPKNLHRNKDTYYIHGKHPVISAIKNPSRKIKIIYIANSFKDIDQLQNHPYKTCDKEILNKLAGENARHQGIVAEVVPMKKYRLKEVDLETTQRIAILDQLTDPQNIGAIIRSAVAFNIDKILITKSSAAIESGTIAKAACGALEHITIIEEPNLKNAIDTLKKLDFWTVGLAASGNDVINEIENINKLAIIIGSEGKGLRKLTQESCDYTVSIKITPVVESLNASNAACIAFYALTKKIMNT